MKSWLKITSGLLLSLLIIIFIIVWDTIIVKKIDSVAVVVIKTGEIIERNEVITDDKLIIEDRDKATLIEGVVYAKDKDKIIGYETNQQLFGNSIMSERYVDYDSLTPDAEKGEAIRPIPNEWIYASPSTIRRKDYIDFYLFTPDGMNQFSSKIMFKGLSPEQRLKIKQLEEQVNEENMKYKKDRESIAKDKNIEVVEADEDILQEKQELMDKIDSVTNDVNAVVKGEKITGTNQERQRERIMQALNISENEWLQFVESGEIPALVDIPIVYVKDGAGNEIKNGKDSTETERLTSTGPVTDLEVLMNEDEYRLIKKYMEMGYKLYITYN